MSFQFELFQNSSPRGGYKHLLHPNSLTTPNYTPRAVFVEPTGNAVGHNFNNYTYYPAYSENSYIASQNPYAYPQYTHPQSAPLPQQYYNQTVLQDIVHQDSSELPEIAIDVARLSPQNSPVQEQAEIFDEIVRECEAIERRSSPSNSSGSSPIYPWVSSDEYESTDSPGPHRNPVRKERKKAQNRLAATRYREKKRKEKEEKMSQISELLVRNDELKKQLSAMESEVNVLKKLMNELGVQY